MCNHLTSDCTALLRSLDADGDPVARGRSGDVHMWLYLNGDVMKVPEALYSALCLPVASENTCLTAFQNAKAYGTPMLML